MAVEFAGPGTKLDDGAIASAATAIGCEPAAVHAVIEVESRGGFLPDGRPKMLFERHYFSRLTGRAYDAAHPDVSNPRRGGYEGGAAEYDRLARAIGLDRQAALRSASWGMFQIMGDNFGRCDFAYVEAFVAAMVSGEPAQLAAFVAFVRHAKLDEVLARHDWAAFARGYNGPAFKANRYDQRLAEAWRRDAAPDGPSTARRPLLQRGSRGKLVATLQRARGVAADGIFGPHTRRAVIAFQRRRGLTPDGIAGRDTWAALDS
jgi:hypothetical protein